MFKETLLLSYQTFAFWQEMMRHKSSWREAEDWAVLDDQGVSFDGWTARIYLHNDTAGPYINGQMFDEDGKLLGRTENYRNVESVIRFDIDGDTFEVRLGSADEGSVPAQITVESTQKALVGTVYEAERRDKMRETLTVSTTGGDIVAEADRSKEYPAILIRIKKDGIDPLVAIVEWDEEAGYFKVHNYAEDSEEPDTREFDMDAAKAYADTGEKIPE